VQARNIKIEENSEQDKILAQQNDAFRAGMERESNGAKGGVACGGF
jgi:hypothetical protein